VETAVPNSRNRNKKEKENFKEVAATLNECYYALEYFLKHNDGTPSLFVDQAKRLMQRIELSKTSVYDMISSKKA
jgi:hypothetical protein